MQRRTFSLLLATGFVGAAAPAWAAAEPNRVRVALLDMSSLMASWAGAGGRGGGPGMMGYGFGGPGMMGPGTTGPGGMGAGMMGPGMMALRADQPSVPAGPVRFEVTNWSRSLPHEMLVIAVDRPDAPLPYDHRTGRVSEEQLRVLADTEDMQPGASKVVEATLAPGSYLLVCNLPGHYAAGMVAPLTATR